jgi:hypothetical protein
MATLVKRDFTGFAVRTEKAPREEKLLRLQFGLREYVSVYGGDYAQAGLAACMDMLGLDSPVVADRAIREYCRKYHKTYLSKTGEEVDGIDLPLWPRPAAVRFAVENDQPFGGGWYTLAIGLSKASKEQAVRLLDIVASMSPKAVKLVKTVKV